MAALDPFTAACAAWFTANFVTPTDVQQRGWEHISQGEHALLLAPTGSGKTLAAFFWAIDRLMRLPVDAEAGVRVLYISPLKALVHDIERNLRAPLTGCQRMAVSAGQTFRDVRVDVRTGDTTAKERAMQQRRPGDILVTTPESLYLRLGSAAAQSLKSVHTIIIDEIHALAPSKRGSHLALSLERLSALCAQEPQRIGLSATVRPPQEAARYLGGDRPVAIVDCSAKAFIDLKIKVPVPDMERPPPVALPAHQAAHDGAGAGAILGLLAQDEAPVKAPSDNRAHGMWASIFPEILQRIQAGQATLVFVNSRSLCERTAERLNALAGEELVRAHHGSLSLRKRSEIEEALKEGKLRGIVATSSLELGIDMGQIDLVVLVESPGSVARGLQRVGRAGHRVGAISHGIIFPKFKGDLLECAVIGERMRDGELEPVVVPMNALDVLAQQVTAIIVQEPMRVDALHALVRRAYPYQNLAHEALCGVLDMLSGAYPSDVFSELRPLLSWDRSQDIISARNGARLTSILNAGTIPDRGTFAVYLVGDGPRLGELDEEMVHESRRGDTFLLGASTWRIQEITRDRVLVTPAPGEPGKMPFWRGDGPGRPIELGMALGAFTRRLGAMGSEALRETCTQDLLLDTFAANNLAQYLEDQRRATGCLPTDRSITIERFRDEMGDWRLCILSPFGARVHAPWALALSSILATRSGAAAQVTHTDDGIMMRFGDGMPLPPLEVLLPDAEDVEELVMQAVGQSALFAGHFRENAARALLLPRRRATGRQPLWQQRLRAKTLMAAAARYPSFPIILETYRQCLRDIFDLPALGTLLQRIKRREVAVDWVETSSPSPFAQSLAFAYVAAYLYDRDAPLAERRAQALTLDRDMLRQLLGDVSLSELLDGAAIEELTHQLQGTASGHKARSPDELWDLLRRVGELTASQIALRVDAQDTGAEAASSSWAQTLVSERRAVWLTVRQQRCLCALDDVALLRDALGVAPASGLPNRVLGEVHDAAQALLARYARCHGPFTLDDLTQQYGLSLQEISATLTELQRAQVLTRGAMVPGGSGDEWCDVNVLRRIKRASMARLRNEVAAVQSDALGRFLPGWHGLDHKRYGNGALEDVITQLAGLPLSFIALHESILPARVTDYSLDMLDMLCAMGTLVWVGCGSLGPKDGKIMLMPREVAQQLCTAPPPYTPPSPLHEAILNKLDARGACFTTELSSATADMGDLAALTQALYDLVWAGQITNDTLGPLRALLSKRPSSRHARGPKSRHAGFGGRWSKVADLRDPAITDTERAHLVALGLLERYGVVSREAAQAEDLPGGFTAVYGVLRAMEEAGKVRRGHFVAGLTGAQFAYAGAIERLRGGREQTAGQRPQAQVIATLDPANPYGALLPWPARLSAEAGHKPRRVPASHVVLAGGALLGYVEPSAHKLLLFAPWRETTDAPQCLIEGLRVLAARAQSRTLEIRTIDGEPALSHVAAPQLTMAGMHYTFDGLALPAVPKSSDA